MAKREMWLPLPRGIYGRAALILFLPVVTVTLVVTVMFLQRHFDDVTRQMTAGMAGELALVAAREASAPGGSADVAGPLGLTVTRPAAVPAGDARRWYDWSGRAVVAGLHAALPALRTVDLAGDDKTVQVVLDDPAGPLAIAFPRKRVSASNPHQLLVLMAATSALMTGVATVFLRNQLRPIRRLAAAAEAYGRGRVDPYRIAGASEVRSAGAAFLDMRNRLERAAEQRTLMLSGISHDLRTPLTRLRLGIGMLDGADPDEVEALTADIDQMGAMLDAFLAHARDTALDAPPQPVAALPWLAGIVADAQRAGQPVTLRAPDLPANASVTLREGAMRRAIENLVGNACAHAGRAVVEASLGPRSLVIAVEDDGPGIPEADREAALRPFVRLDPARGQNSGRAGTGLGLAIAADIARAHGGRLRLGNAGIGGLRAEIVIPR